MPTNAHLDEQVLVPLSNNELAVLKVSVAG